MKNQYAILLLILSFLFIINSCSCDLIDDLIDDEPIGSQYQTGDTLWIHTNLVEKTAIAMPLAYHNKTLYYGIAGGTLWWTAGKIVALDTEDGSIKWTSNEIAELGVTQIVIGDDGTIYTLGGTFLYAIDPSDGSFKWTWEVPEQLPNPDGPGNVYTYGDIGGLALLGNGNLVFSSGARGGSYTRAIYCISPTGNKLWHNIKSAGWGTTSGISVGKQDRIFYYADAGGYKLICLDGETGGNIWSKPIQATSTGDNQIVVMDDGNLLCSYKAVGEDQFRFRQINASNGDVLWTSADESNGHAFLTSKNGKIYQGHYYNVGLKYFDLTTGQSYKFTDLPRGPVCALDDDSNIYLATKINNLWGLGVFDSNGNVDWSNEIDGLYAEPYIISEDRVIFAVLDEDGGPSRLPQKIIAIQGENQLATTGWPKKWHDNRNTSNVTK